MDKMLYENLRKDYNCLKDKIDNINEWIQQHDIMENVYKYNEILCRL